MRHRSREGARTSNPSSVTVVALTHDFARKRSIVSLRCARDEAEKAARALSAESATITAIT